MAVVIPQQSYTRGYYPVRQPFSQPYAPIPGQPTYVPHQVIASPYHSVVNPSASVRYVTPQQVYQPQQITQQIIQRDKTTPVAPSDLPVPTLGPNMTEVTYRIVGTEGPITEPVISEITYRLLGADGTPLNGGGETSRDIEPVGDLELAKPLLPGQHLPTADGFTSPYETLPQSLNRNPFFRSFYDVPAALRTAEQPPPDFVIHQEDPNAHLLGGPPGQEPYYEPAYGQPVEFQRGRLRLLAQREEQLKDHGPAVHLSEFTLYDPYGIPIDMRDAIASCPSLGYSPDGEEPQRAIDMSGLGLKFSRREIPHFPVDLEVDLGRRVAVGSYSWTTAMDTPGRDPVSWSFQILTSHGWVTLDQVTDYDVTKARSAVVGPFRLDVAGDPTVLNPPPPPPQQRVIEGPLDYNSVATERLFELLNTGGSDHITERVEELLRKLANPNAVDSYGRTPLLKACVRGDAAAIRLLLDYNADANAQARTGESGLHRLALSTDDIHCMEALLQAGADPNVFDGQGDTPLMISAARADPASVQLLLRSGARADLRNTRYQTALDMLEEEVRRQGPNVSVQNASEVRRLLSASGPQLF